MPYIAKADRPKFDSLIEDVVDALTDHGYKNFEQGELNYVVSSIVWKLFEQNKKYGTGSKLKGVLDDVKDEFYRRKMVPYEDEKIKEHGDL